MRKIIIILNVLILSLTGVKIFADVGLLSGKYYGETKEGKPHGKGKLITKEGDVFEGTFVNGEGEGFFKVRYADGETFEGYFKKNLAEGKGKYLFKSRNLYEGEYKNGKCHGFGKLYYANGDKYWYINGKLHREDGPATIITMNKKPNPLLMAIKFRINKLLIILT